MANFAVATTITGDPSGAIGAFRAVRLAAGGLTGITRGLARSVFSLRGALAGLGVGLGVREIGRAITDYADAGDSVDEFSRRIGFNIEALQEWRFVAERVGIGAEAFDGAIAKMSRGIGEARLGTGALSAALKKRAPAVLK